MHILSERDKRKNGYAGSSDLHDEYIWVSGVCFLIAIENIFPPIPSEVILTFGGFMTTYTRLTVPGVIVFSTIGSLIGALILYRVGLELNRERLGRVMESRMFQRLGFEKSDVEKTIAAFDKHGKKAVLFGRCIPIIRSLVSVRQEWRK